MKSGLKDLTSLIFDLNRRSSSKQKISR